MDDTTQDTTAHLTQRVALFRHIQYGYLMVWSRPSRADDAYCPMDCVRLSEWQDVAFTEISGDEQIQGAIASLQKQRAEISRDYAAKLATVDAQISNLRAITHQPVAS